MPNSKAHPTPSHPRTKTATTPSMPASTTSSVPSSAKSPLPYNLRSLRPLAGDLSPFIHFVYCARIECGLSFFLLFRCSVCAPRIHARPSLCSVLATLVARKILRIAPIINRYSLCLLCWIYPTHSGDISAAVILSSFTGGTLPPPAPSISPGIVCPFSFFSLVAYSRPIITLPLALSRYTSSLRGG